MGCSYCATCEECSIGGVLGCKKWPKRAESVQKEEPAARGQSAERPARAASRCLGCGTLLDSEWRFCPRCGLRVIGDEAANADGGVARVTAIPPKKSGTRGAHLLDVKAVVSKSTNRSSFVMCFDDGAEVVMPGTWTIREEEFPNGIYEGQKLAAYWELDESGTKRFHLYEVR